MPRTNSFATCLFSLACGLGAAAAPLSLDVMPAPWEVHLEPGRWAASSRLEISITGSSDSRLKAAAARTQQRWQARSLGPATGGVTPPDLVLKIECQQSGDGFPIGTEDESYTLKVADGKAVLQAATDLGALHGLETFLQLPQKDGTGWFLPGVGVQDRPRFAWRGLMIDVARHWQPIEVIERNLDAMAVVKLNVLHLHLTDDQGFRIESLTHPELQAKGSDGDFFTQSQIRTILAYAAARGIRVVPEFDVPGHATSWVVSHPELASLPGPYSVERQWGVFNPVLDPTNEATYALLADFLGEMASLFPDRCLHIGGDENNGVQWKANPRIQAFIHDHGLRDNEGLHAYFNTRIDAILKQHGKRLVGWDEILNTDLPRDCVIDSWRGTDALAAAAKLGFDGLLSNGFYIDLCYPASDHYSPDPLPRSTSLVGADRARILGGEATMWSEWVTPETIDSRIWPRTAAVAERLWSPQEVRDQAEMYRRLALVSRRLEEAGSLHNRNEDLMLRHLVGVNLDAPGVASLRTVVSLVEPVKHYQRGKIQIWSNQLVPLIGLVDAAKPESDPSRKFAESVNDLLFGSAAVDPAQAESLGTLLSRWSTAAREVAASVAPTFPAAREALPAARGLTDACALGAQALKALESGTAEDSSAALSTLDGCAAPNESATVLPMLASVRLLVVAASKQDHRSGLSSEQWKALVTASAFPVGSAEAVH